jgi:drug/metabolite transporter (DMT)-like permease
LGIFVYWIALVTWDYGIKHGDIRTLAGICYALPLISTVALILRKETQINGTMIVAAAMVGLGAAVASKDLWGRRKVQGSGFRVQDQDAQIAKSGLGGSGPLE